VKINDHVRLFALLEENILRDCELYENNEAVKRLVKRYNKRFPSGNEKPLERAAYDDFLRCNAEVSKPCLDSFVVNNARVFIERALWRFTKEYVDVPQSTLDVGTLLSLWKFGPGASNGVKGTHFVDKVKQKWTCTNRAEPIVKLVHYTNPHLKQFFADSGTMCIDGSRITTVPKNQEKRRTIAIEPSGNMALQLAAGMYLEGALRRIGIDITTQADINKSLAQSASLGDKLSTIDLKNASDMISIDLVRQLMPHDWSELLQIIRSDEATVEGIQHKLNMISTMGNGFTFPLMTLIFVALYYGYRCSVNKQKSFRLDFSEFGVFGDDIILPSDDFCGFCDVLVQAGLVINTEKSYQYGPFKESCGGDFYNGANITPFYIKDLSSKAHVYIALNQVLSWCGIQKVCFYNTLNYLRSLIDGKLFLVPFWSDDYSGVRTSRVPMRYSMLVRKTVSIPFKGDEQLGLLCVLGGYVESPVMKKGLCPGAAYTTRECEKKSSYVRKDTRLPRGFLDGRSPDGDRSAHAWVDGLVEFLV